MIEMSLVQDQVPDLGGDEIVETLTDTRETAGTIPMQTCSEITHSTPNPNVLTAHLNVSSTCSATAGQTSQPEMDIRTVPISPNNHQVSTRLGKAVEIVLGSTTEVQMFDGARSNLKKSPKSKYAIEQYKKKLAVIQTRVLAQKRGLTKLLKDWEKEFFLNQDCRMATVNEMKANEQASKLLNQLKYTDALLKEWKIKF